jgi:hypothetical protein
MKYVIKLGQNVISPLWIYVQFTYVRKPHGRCSSKDIKFWTDLDSLAIAESGMN